MQLNSQQLAAVNAPIKGVHLIQALAGSGKTTLLRHRTKYLLRAREQTGDYCSKVLLLAFNKDVVSTLEEKLEQDLSKIEYKRVTIRTFHGMATFMINRFREHLPQLQVKSFSIPKDSHLTMLASDWITKNGHKLKQSQIKVLLGLDAETSNLNVSVRDLFYRSPKLSGMLGMDHLEASNNIKLLRKFRYETGNLTFSDLIPLARTLPDVCYQQCGIDDLLVDELQDLNFQQREFAYRFVPFADQFTGVGDPRQSIYSFQGCDEHIFEKIVSRFPNAVVYPLTTNYRCSEPIISLANKVLTNELESEHILVGTGKLGGDPTAEIGTDGLISWLHNNIAQGKSWKDMAILFRARSHTPELEAALAQARIPYKVDSNSFFEQSVVEDIIAYFYLLYHPKPEYGYWRHITRHFGGFNELAAEHIWEATNGKPLSHPSFDVPSGIQSWMWKKYQAAISNYKTLAVTSSPSELARAISKDLYDRWAYLYGHKLETLEFYLDIADAFCEWTYKYGADGFQILQTIELRQRGVDEDDNCVQVITVHKSKGREWPCVAIWSLKDGLFPHKQADLGEENRLLYVAVTRAQETLALIGLDETDRQSTLIKYIGE